MKEEVPAKTKVPAASTNRADKKNFFMVNDLGITEIAL